MGDEGEFGYRAEDLRQFVQGVLEHYGMPAPDAALGAEVLIDADLSGVSTHGLSNFPLHWHYAPGLRDGTVQPEPVVSVLRESPVAAAWDSGRGFGPVVAHRAMSAAIEKARQAGIGMVTVRDGCHFGAIGYYARMAAEADMIGMVMCHTAPAAVAPGGADRLFGTNPLAVAAPVAGSHPFCFDMAVTAAAGTKVQVARRLGQAIPAGWAADAEGRPTTDPEVYAAGGALLPLGMAEGAGHKGFGLGLVVDILSGVLSGTGSGLFTQFGPDWRQGYWMAAWRVDLFCDPGEFKAELGRAFDAIRQSRPAPGTEGVLVPGDRSAAERERRGCQGIPLDPEVVRQCQALGADTGVAFPAPLAPPRVAGSGGA